MAATHFRFDPSELYNVIWDAFKWCPHTQFLNLTPATQQTMTLGLVGCVVDELFLSVPEDECRRYEVIIAEHLSNPLGLQNMLHHMGEVEAPQAKMGVVLRDIGHVLTIHRAEQREYWETLSRTFLCKLAFSKVYETIRDYIETRLHGLYQQAGKAFNPYALATFDVSIFENYQIISIDLVVENDVREIFYKQHFPSGRYKKGH